ncbi:MAG: GFA family protein [Alphaproteobacteria bacterium]|nr:GFA family protein [Alphaproteobacteria bacterium]MBU6471688.1 GFA family protein [Alphaproteobacteria bacterium]MDE1985012.1 GFA family protein [Alphaproteobacteria bacterium]MDE2162353.1 GFA family protein [Alphaproteobacteria bacterium]
MIEASCHCGAVRLEIETAPETVTSCNCSICRRTGVLCAYYSPKNVHLVPAEGATDIYMWGDKSIEFHRCKICGCATHWAPVDKTLDRMGVNARLMAPEVLAAARVRRFDGADTWKYLDEA